MQVLQIIYDSIDELNTDLEAGEHLSKTEETSIFGAGDSLDSLQLVNLITIIEQRLEDETGEFISLADEKAMSLEESPFKTVATLKAYIETLLNGG